MLYSIALPKDMVVGFNDQDKENESTKESDINFEEFNLLNNQNEEHETPKFNNGEDDDDGLASEDLDGLVSDDDIIEANQDLERDKRDDVLESKLLEPGPLLFADDDSNTSLARELRAIYADISKKDPDVSIIMPKEKYDKIPSYFRCGKYTNIHE